MTSTAFEIPTSPQPQRFSIALNNVTYVILLRWVTPSNCWLMSIYDSSNVPILEGVPLVAGLDLLEQFGYFEFGGGMIAELSGDPAGVPDFAGMGDTGHLYYVTPKVEYSTLFSQQNQDQGSFLLTEDGNIIDDEDGFPLLKG